MRKSAIVLLVLAAIAAPALAAPVQFQMGVSPTSRTASDKGSVGGEYTLTPLSEFLPLAGYRSGITSDILVPGSFQTFCIEPYEPISGYPATYWGS